MARAAYRVNDTDRCFHCKAELMDVLAPIAAAEGATRRARRQRRRPRRPPPRPAGRRREAGAAFPLVAAGFTKADVRAASAALGLRTWDKPAAACLASRVPYGTEVTVAVLSRVERAEAALRDLGFAPGARPPLRRHRPHRGRRWTIWPRVVAAASGDRRRRARPPATATSRSTSRASARATSTAERRDGVTRRSAMKLAMMINYSGDFHADVDPGPGARAGRPRPGVGARGVLVRRHQPGRLPRRQDRAGRDRHRASSTSSRGRPRLIAQTAAGCDFVSDGRFVLGLGASGPQVIEGFHGVPYEHPMPRIREYIEVCRMTWRREPVVYDGPTVQIPLPAGQGTGLGKPLKLINHPKRADIPIFWASLMGKSVAEHGPPRRRLAADLLRPREVPRRLGRRPAAGLAERDPTLGPLQISAGGMVAIGDEYAGDGADRVLDLARPRRALYVGGMGARDKNFYNTIAKSTATSTRPPRSRTSTCPGARRRRPPPCPAQLLAGDATSSGPESYVAERIAAYREAGVTHLSVNPVGPDPVKTVETLRRLLD